VQAENSWYLKTGFSTHHFLCHCGQIDECSDRVLLNRHHPAHRCSYCGNTHYLDAVMFVNDKKVNRWLSFIGVLKPSKMKVLGAL
jgi:hypothetical protein